MATNREEIIKRAGLDPGGLFTSLRQRPADFQTVEIKMSEPKPKPKPPDEVEKLLARLADVSTEACRANFQQP